MQKAQVRPVSPLLYLIIVIVAGVTLLALKFSQPVVMSPSPVAGLMHLKTMEQITLPYETAIANGKPTLLEFYADWCSSCQAMATTVEQLRDRHGSQLNLVMINIDNPAQGQWVKQYEVTGVPQFIALNADHQVIDRQVGQLPYSVLSQMFEQLDLGLSETGFSEG